MSLSVNNVINKQSYPSVKTSESKSNDKDKNQIEDDKDTHNSSKKKRIISMKEGKFYCTYMIDDDGMKVLIKKVPIVQVQKQNNLDNSKQSDDINALDYNAVSTTRAAFEYKRHKSHLKDIMNIINDSFGIQKNSTNKLF